MDMMSEEELIDQIVENRELIAQQNMLGSEIAGEVMKWYCMWYACPGDNMAYVVLEDKFQQWKAQQ